MNTPQAIAVPLKASYVLSPIVRYGDPFDAVFFPLERDAESDARTYGRVTFERLDSLRCCRGEYWPFEPEPGGSWVHEIRESAWLKERHAYEKRFYDTPLLEDYRHYLLVFHDEFVEAIAEGIWFEAIGSAFTDEMPENHPFKDLPASLPAESFEVDRLHCDVRTNPRPLVELIAASELCSQKLFQFGLTLDGEWDPMYAAELRTVRGKPVTRLRARGYPDLLTVQGVAKVEDVLSAWKQYVAEVAARRRKMGKRD